MPTLLDTTDFTFIVVDIMNSHPSFGTINESSNGIIKHPETESSTRLKVGDTGRRHHMQPFTKIDDKLHAIQQLAINDFAFVRRSDGKWNYSIVVDIVSVANDESGENQQQYIKFLVDSTEGQTKTIPMHKWVKFIRIVKKPQRRVSWNDECLKTYHFEDVEPERNIFVRKSFIPASSWDKQMQF
jgi:hypothetical protein